MGKTKVNPIILVVLIALLTLVVAVSSASAETRNIVLLDAVVKEGRGGATFTFRVFGEFEKFDGFVRYSGRIYDLNCHLRKSDDSILVCHGSEKGLRVLGDQAVQVVVNGFSFTTYVEHKWCYPVFEFTGVADEPGSDAEADIPASFSQWTSHCQGHPAELYDVVELVHPVYGLTPNMFLTNEFWDVTHQNYPEGYYTFRT